MPPPQLPPGVGPGRHSAWQAGWGAYVGLLVATLVAWAPLISVLLTFAIAGALECRVDEGSVHPCPGPFGTDLGPALYTMGVMGWLMLVTAPFMLVTGLAWTLLLLRWAWRKLRS